MRRPQLSVWRINVRSPRASLDVNCYGLPMLAAHQSADEPLVDELVLECQTQRAELMRSDLLIWKQMSIMIAHGHLDRADKMWCSAPDMRSATGMSSG